MKKSEENKELKEEQNQGKTPVLDSEEWEFGWKFHRGPILIAAILTVIFYLCIMIFVK
jgi:hypothetical protein